MPPRREREFLIKWKYLSYWHCSWMSETFMEVHFMQTMRMYWRKMDTDIPPEVCFSLFCHEEFDLYGQIDNNSILKFYRMAFSR